MSKLTSKAAYNLIVGKLTKEFNLFLLDKSDRTKAQGFAIGGKDGKQFILILGNNNGSHQTRIITEKINNPPNIDGVRYVAGMHKGSRVNQQSSSLGYCNNIKSGNQSSFIVDDTPSLERLIRWYSRVSSIALASSAPIISTYRLDNPYESLLSLHDTANTNDLYVISSYSWRIVNSNTAIKLLDKSAFLHRGTGIPYEVRPFFLQGDMVSGEKRHITLVHDGNAYSAHIDMEGQDTARTRLFWNVAFSSLLRKTFPYHYEQYNANSTPESEIVLQLERLEGFNSYRVTFNGIITDTRASADIWADELEDKGPQKEGGVKEYYGKRYERSTTNRKVAIRIHGLSCNVCGFNFEAIYGARGAAFIEVHHVKPIHTYKKEQSVDPKADLITLCANCHKMVHRDPGNILSVEDLRRLLAEVKGIFCE